MCYFKFLVLPGIGSLDVDTDFLPANLAIPLETVLIEGGLNPFPAGLTLGIVGTGCNPPDVVQDGGGILDWSPTTSFILDG